ncbi:MAG: hypothetical protein NT159_11860 [Proteobacteria bacterium]|nr:hypothetical protein [Pseudomonadota bacterium]
MPFQEIRRRGKRSLNWAIAASLVLHGVALFVPRHAPPSQDRSQTRLEATLAPRAQTPIIAEPTKLPPAAAAAARPRARKRILTTDKPIEAMTDPKSRQWSVAEKEDMNRFLFDLENEAKARPDLAQRSLAMAGEIGRQPAPQDVDRDELLERRPDGPPVDPFSLEMYLDGLVRKLNRSADFVKNDPRSRGLRVAKVRIRFNPNGSLRSFQVLNAADQQEEIAYVKSVVDQAVPFSPFPADILRSAQSLAMDICILPANTGGPASPN